MAQAPVEGSQLMTNLDVMRELAGEIAVRAIKEAELKGVTDLEISVVPKEASWYIEGSIHESLAPLSMKTRTDTLSPLMVEFGISEARVEYSNVRKDWLFGSRMIDRTVHLRLATKILERRTGAVKLLTEYDTSRTDTIGLSEVIAVENPAIPMTKGRQPQQSFFSNLAEPLVLVGSVAVAVLLLFNVRS